MVDTGAHDDGLKEQIAGIAALDEPARRDLYLYIVQRGGEVGRDEAARALGMSRALAAFHLDRLVEDGLLEVSYRRLSGRSGPGAGRPSKLYRRSGRQLHVSLPPRSYELAARLFAETIASVDAPDVRETLTGVAQEFGAQIGHQASVAREAPMQALAACGYEPCQTEDGSIRLRNCPFHALAEEHRALVCGMNLSLMQGLVEGLEDRSLEPILDPQPDMCCVRLRPA